MNDRGKQSWPADFANLMVDLCNQEGRALDAEEFAYRTQHRDALERDAIWQALPLWAQRNIERTMAMIEDSA